MSFFCRTVLFGLTAFYRVVLEDGVRQGLASFAGGILCFHHGKVSGAFRVSIKEQKGGRALKVELIDAPGLWGERRCQIRVNGRAADKIKQATLLEVLDRLRRRIVQRRKKRDRASHSCSAVSNPRAHA